MPNGDYVSLNNTVNNQKEDYVVLNNTVNNHNGEYVPLDNTVNIHNGDYVPLDNTVDNPDEDYLSLDYISQGALNNVDYTQLDVQDTEQANNISKDDGKGREMSDDEVPSSSLRNDTSNTKENKSTVYTLKEDIDAYNNCILDVEKHVYVN